MTAEIIFWIAMVFFIVSPARLPSVLGKSGTKRPCDSGMVPTHKSDYNHTANNDGKAMPLSNPNKTDSRDIANERMMMCCQGYKNETGSSKPDCSPKCENGKKCVGPNKCRCNNFRKNFYNETLLCIITRPILVNNSETERQSPAGGKVQCKGNDFAKKLEKLPQCLPECLNHLNNTRATCIVESGNKTYHLLLIDSPCNNKAPLWAFLKKWRYAIGGALGILLVTIVTCVVCLVKRKPRTEGPREDIPLATKCPDYMEDNVLYS